MSALPAATDYTGSSVTQGGKKTFMTALRTFLNDALGADSSALVMPGTLSVATFGSLGGSTVGTYHRMTNSVASQYTLVMTNANATDPYGLRVVHSGVTANTTGNFFEGADSAGLKVRIRNDGNITNSNNSYGAISDPDLKRDVVLAGSQWDDVKALAARVVKYRFKNDPQGPLQIGWLSRDSGGFGGAKAVSPGLVFENAEVEQRVTGKDADGKDVVRLVPTGTVIEGVAYSVAHMKAFKALGEALERIESLEAEVAALKAAA